LTLHRYEPGGWQALNVDHLVEAFENGPAYINPYDPDAIFVLTDAGVLSSLDGGRTAFQPEDQLNVLITHNGRYPITAWSVTYNGTFNCGNGRAFPRGIMSSMAFSRNHPDDIVAASAYGGVFYNTGDPKARQWKDLTGLLPTPSPPIGGVAIDDDDIYVGTEGRGLLQIVGYRETLDTIDLADILQEIYEAVLVGVVNDAGGIEMLNGILKPVPPMGPFWAAFERRTVDAIVALIAQRIVNLLSDRERARELFEILTPVASPALGAVRNGSNRSISR
jgi:hypothetical protein